jgi:riboflavin biosynthesis pyrimidine reductase
MVLLKGVDIMALHYPWPGQGFWLRAVMLMGLDGAIAGSDGRSGSLSNAEDKALLGQLRLDADAVLIGAQTFRAERYRPLRLPDPARQRRLSEGRQPSPRLVIVSGSLLLPWDEPAFADSDQPPLVITSGRHSSGALQAASERCEIAAIPGESVDPQALIAALQKRGLLRIVCEGGRLLLDSLAAQGLVDEWALTVAPIAASARYELAAEEASEDYLYTRYVKRAEP